MVCSILHSTSTSILHTPNPHVCEYYSGMDIRDRIHSLIDADDKRTVRNVSLKAGFSSSWLDKFLKGDVRSPTLDSIEKLAVALEVDARWLAFGEGTPERYADIGRMIEKMTEEQAELARQMIQVITRTGTDG